MRSFSEAMSASLTLSSGPINALNSLNFPNKHIAVLHAQTQYSFQYDSKNKLTLERSLKHNATFWPASTGLDHALVMACDWTQILVEGSGCRWGQPVSLILIHGGVQYLGPATGQHQCMIKTISNSAPK